MLSMRRAYFAWAVVCVVWGTTYLAIRVALESIPPILMAAIRWIAAGAILIAALKIRGERLPGPRTWPALTVLGILLLGFGNGAVVWAEQTVASGLTAVLVATVPFWMVGVDALTGPRVGLARQAPCRTHRII
jgi:drug/metabolite transporter (DMT)-like permease